jgi:hypothetical protein
MNIRQSLCQHFSNPAPNNRIVRIVRQPIAGDFIQTRKSSQNASLSIVMEFSFDETTTREVVGCKFARGGSGAG